MRVPPAAGTFVSASSLLFITSRPGAAGHRPGAAVMVRMIRPSPTSNVDFLEQTTCACTAPSSARERDWEVPEVSPLRVGFIKFKLQHQVKESLD